MSEKTLRVEDDDFDMYISRSKKINTKTKDSDVLFEEAVQKTKPKKIKKPLPKKEIPILEEEIKEKPITEEPIVEDVVDEEKVAEEKPIVETVLSKEDLILQKLAYLEQGINNIIEAIPEMVNQSISDYADLKNKIALLEENVIYNSGEKPKIIKFHRNEKGQIEQAEVG